MILDVPKDALHLFRSSTYFMPAFNTAIGSLEEMMQFPVASTWHYNPDRPNVFDLDLNGLPERHQVSSWEGERPTLIRGLHGVGNSGSELAFRPAPEYTTQKFGEFILMRLYPDFEAGASHELIVPKLSVERFIQATDIADQLAAA